MTEEQEEIYQHSITSLLDKIEKRDHVIAELRLEIKKLKAKAKEEGCNGRGSDNKQ